MDDVIMLDDDSMLADANAQAERHQTSTGATSLSSGSPANGDLGSTTQQPQSIKKGEVKGSRTAAESFDTAFKDHHYPYPVTRQTVLDYFSRSPFYDKNCNNEIIREQNKPLEALQYMRGLEYVTFPNKHEPRLFVVVKQIRSSEHSATKKALYYVLDQVIYQAPNVRQICLRRIRSASENISEAMEFFAQYRSFSCVEGRTWSFPSDTHGLWRESAESARFKRGTERRNVKKTRRVNAALLEAVTLAEEHRESTEQKEQDETKTSVAT